MNDKQDDGVDGSASLDRITIDATVCCGAPCIRGMRFPVYQIVALVAAGNSFSAILGDFPDLEEEDIRQALQYAAHLARPARPAA